MGDKSGIQWTDASWNPTTGCTRVSPGCDHCYAFALHDQRHQAYLAGEFPDAPPQYHKPFSEVQLLSGDRLTLPLRWRRPRKVFVDSMADLFHKDVPDEFIERVFAIMALCPEHTFQILTKRPQRMSKFLTETWQPDIHARSAGVTRWETRFDRILDRTFDYTDPDSNRFWTGDGGNKAYQLPWPLPNVWLGVSVENQDYAWRIDWLAKTPAAVRFLSIEPMIGPVDLDAWLWEEAGPEWAGKNPSPTIDWVITGGESGPEHRPFDPAWAMAVRDQCVEAGVAYFHKQNGGRTPKAGGRLLDGRTWDEFPTVQGAQQS